MLLLKKIIVSDCLLFKTIVFSLLVLLKNKLPIIKTNTKRNDIFLINDMCKDSIFIKNI